MRKNNKNKGLFLNLIKKMFNVLSKPIRQDEDEKEDIIPEKVANVLYFKKNTKKKFIR